MKKIKRLITNIKFWVWAAMHCERFHYFQIVLHPGVKITCGKKDVNYYDSYILIRFYKPKIMYDLSTYAAAKYANLIGISTDEIYTLDDIPF